MDASADQRRMVSDATSSRLDVEAELEWFAELLDKRLKSYFDVNDDDQSTAEIPSAPDLSIERGYTRTDYTRLVLSLGLGMEERVLLLLALIPFIRPQLLDVLWSKNNATERGFTEFGGISGSSHGGFLPTVETALFILGGDDMEQRLYIMRLLHNNSRLLKQGIVQVGAVQNNEPWSSGQLKISREFVDQLVYGTSYKPSFGVEFPARRIEIRLGWDDLVLPASMLEQLDEIRDWIQHGDTLLGDWGMRDKLAPGFTSLFYGPPGTGKTMSACLLGKRCDCDVYKVDLSAIVSKYIGETEKNLARIFDAAENQGWILFFDEADALFGKRTKVDDSHDRYANQEISFLLQRIEDFKGVVILASNFKSNIDDSFIRRFQSVIRFTIPKSNERQRIWANAFSTRARLEKSINLARIASQYEVSGGTIMNVVRYASLRSVSRDSDIILLDDIEEGLRREKLKEGRNL
jgi:hypothetical protein